MMHMNTLTGIAADTGVATRSIVLGTVSFGAFQDGRGLTAS